MEFSSFSIGTERAVKTWQSTLGVHEDGVMSSQLLERLFTGRENDDSQIKSDQMINKLGSLNGVPQVASVSKIAGTQQSLIKDFGSVKDNVTKNRVFLLGENRWEEPSRLVKSVQSGNERNPTSTSAKCLTCRGEKRLMCVECDGSGEPNIEQQFMEWVGEETKCPYCDGLGYTICDACQE
ncbi:hypothetical protein ZOSMA_122G00920 [Zostera marina]|uniref:Peptidoglycan binding-like domain-containing protein n=1 Tax=Zostera marina TaxID=29655 RepID=A0A0K9Q0Z2_ZOSMR|nr:hypothetical protein ZOSMA_122G00920 [Zostera marina]